VTVVLEALFALANAEAILTIARRQGSAHKEATEEMYNNSTMWPSAGSARDVVSVGQNLIVCTISKGLEYSAQQ
jgi:hypothetical protein